MKHHNELLMPQQSHLSLLAVAVAIIAAVGVDVGALIDPITGVAVKVFGQPSGLWRRTGGGAGDVRYLLHGHEHTEAGSSALMVVVVLLLLAPV